MKPRGIGRGPERLAARPDRSRTLAGLARLLAAGVSPVRALEMLATEPDCDQRRLARAARLAGTGTSPTAALYLSGFITAAERAGLEVFASVGRLDLGIDELARDLEREAAFAATVKARLALPGAVGVLGALTAPLPGLMRGDLSGTDYLVMATGPVMLTVAIFTLAVRLLRQVPAEVLARLRQRRGLPPAKRTRRRIFAALARTLGAGLDPASAVRASAATVPGPWSGALARAAARAAGGRPIADTLAARGIAIMSATEHIEFASAEAAGALPDALARRVRALDMELDRRTRAIAAWLPRIVYALVTAWVLSGLF